MRKSPGVMWGAGLRSASPHAVHRPRPATAFRTEGHRDSIGCNGVSGRLGFTIGAESSVEHTGFAGSDSSMVRRFVP